MSSEVKKKPWLTVGSLSKKKSGGLYIKVENDVTLKKGQYLQLRDAKQGLEWAVETGKITQEKADEIAQFKKYDVFLAPESDNV